MASIRTVFLAAILIVSLSVTTVAVTADRTALSASFATETADDAGVYESMSDEVRDAMGESVPDEPENWPLERSPADLFDDVFTDAHAREQLEPSLEALYAFLRGETDELELRVDTEPTSDALLEEIESDLRDTDLADFDVPESETISAMADSEDAFERERGDFRAEEKERIQEETDEELSDEELEEAFEDERDEIRADLEAELEAELDETLGDDDVSRAIEPAVREIVTAYVDAKLGVIEYDEYASRIDAAHDDLVDGVLDVMEAKLDEELTTEVDLTDELGSDTEAHLETARDYVSLFSLALWGSVVASLVLAGLVVVVAPAQTAATTVGAATSLAGALGVGAAAVLDDAVEDAIEDALIESDAPEFLGDLALGFVDGFFGTWQSYSLIVLAIGICSIGVGVAIRRGVILAE